MKVPRAERGPRVFRQGFPRVGSRAGLCPWVLGRGAEPVQRRACCGCPRLPGPWRHEMGNSEMWRCQWGWPRPTSEQCDLEWGLRVSF